MPEQNLVKLMSELGRLLSRRSSTPRGEALGIAHRKIRAFAEVTHESDEWCDKVLLTFLSGQHDLIAA